MRSRNQIYKKAVTISNYNNQVQLDVSILRLILVVFNNFGQRYLRSKIELHRIVICFYQLNVRGNSCCKLMTPRQLCFTYEIL